MFGHNMRGKSTVALSIAIMAAGFVLFLVGVNLYKYFKVKTHFAAEIITRINENEVDKLRGLFSQVSGKLLVIRDLGSSGALKFSDIVSLNRKFMPLLENQDLVNGITLADNFGQEYFLQKKGAVWVTRVTRQTSHGSEMMFQEWVAPDRPVKSWIKNATHDPRKRPWFRRTVEKRQVYWTPVYKFFSSGKPGITASVWWNRYGSSNGFFVFAMDISLDRIQELLAHVDKKRTDVTFLLNPGSGFFITNNYMGSVASKPEMPGARSVNATEKQLVSAIFREWNAIRKQPAQFVKLNYRGEKWLAAMRPVDEGHDVFWVGIAAPEQVLLADLRKALIQVDVSDVAVALAGSALLLLLFWRLGGFRAGGEEVQEPPSVRLHRYINQGEGSSVEFKSTVRTNLRAGKRGKEIELAWLKAVVAFLNSKGGTLLIGVDDGGRIVGIEADGFENQDRCHLHLKNLINQHIGAEYSSFIQISLVDVDGSTVVLMECQPANGPVFLRIGKNEEFYIRSGPSSVKLSPSQMISYVLQNMKS